MELVCPKCGKVGKSQSVVPGQAVRCPACRESFQVPINEPDPVVVADQPIARKTQPSRLVWITSALIPLAVIGGVAIGWASVPSRTPRTQELEPSAPVAAPEPALDDSKKPSDPIMIAGLYWAETETEIWQLCLLGSENLIQRKILVGPAEIATVLAICGRAEHDWRGGEKCVGSGFPVLLYVEMVSEGTRSEDAVRILANLYRVRPSLLCSLIWCVFMGCSQLRRNDGRLVALLLPGMRLGVSPPPPPE